MEDYVKINGEYWIMDGYTVFADGDIGDYNHEGYATEHVFGAHQEEIYDLADEYDISHEDNRYHDNPNPEELSKLLSEIQEKIVESMPEDEQSESEASAIIMQKLQIDQETLTILYGYGDAAGYCMRREGWIAVRDNNAELYGWNTNSQKSLASGLDEILSHDGDDDAPDELVEINVYDHLTKKSFDVTLAQLKQPNIPVVSPSQPTTTYNRSLYHQSNPRDEEENKYSQPKPSVPNKWTATARKAKVIGPGQDLWRGTSESFSEWLLRETRANLPYVIRQLVAEARKAGDFETFQKDYQFQLKHGLYYHWTDNPNFTIDPSKGPRDMSSIADGSVDPGKLMVTSHLAYWSDYGPKGKGRQYVAVIDMSDVPRNAYRQVNRGFGNEFFVNDPSRAKVYKVLNRKQAFQFDRNQSKYLPKSDEELYQIFQMT